MTEPTEDEILLKAKQLARDDGRLRLWDSEYDQLRRAVVVSLTMLSELNTSIERDSC